MDVCLECCLVLGFVMSCMFMMYDGFVFFFKLIGI